MSVLALRRKIGDLSDRRKALAETIAAENRDFTEDEKTQFEGAKSEIEAIKQRIAVLEEIDSEQADLNKSAGSTGGSAVRIEVGKDNLADHPFGGYANPSAVNDKKEVRKALGQFCLDVYGVRSGISERLAKWSRTFAAGDGMNATIGHDGAYLLPSVFGSLVDRIALENSVVRPRATVVPMSSLRMSYPVVDDTTHASSTVFGGIQAYFKSEEAQLTSSKPAFSTAELDLHKLTALAYVSGEMLDWSPVSLGSWLPDKLGQAIAWKEDDKFISGSGAGGEPTGLLYATAIISIAKEAGQAAATIVLDNIIKMDARLWDMSGARNIIWIANRTCKKVLPKMTLSVGTGGVPVFMPADSAAGRPLATLYGYPIVFTEKAAALGTVGDIMLVNLSEYIIGDAQGKNRSERDIGLKFDYDQTAFRVITYTGGLCPWRSAFTPKNGDSLSPVISLATRS